MQVQATDHFCGHCGNDLSHSIEPETRQKDIFSIITPSLIYYLTTLALLAAYKLTSVFPEGLDGMLIVTIIDVAIVLVFVVIFFREIKPLLSFVNFRFSIATLTVLGALAGALFISWFANIIQLSISDDVFYDTYQFQETDSPLFLSVLFVCVQPALFEELAFRGFLFNNIQKVSSVIGTVYITSFIFGILHLAIVSLLWLVPIGLVFALLRSKYNTLWYGVIGHFTYNLGIVLVDFYFPYSPI